MDGMEFPNLNLLGDSFAQVSHRSRGFKRERFAEINWRYIWNAPKRRPWKMTIQLKKEANVKHLQD